jgi:2-C-methyl-D-erythritol 4-phosphate cytidylyltransferase
MPGDERIPTFAIVLPAAGAASRYLDGGAVRHKLDEDLGGKPVLQRTVEAFTKFDADDVRIGAIVVAGPHDDADFAEFRDRHVDRLSLLGATLVRGGKTHRWETVRAALAAVPAECTHVAVHDAARPCIGFDVMHRVFRASVQFGAAIPGIPAPDTLKKTRVDASLRSEADEDKAAAILGLEPKREPARVVTQTLSRDGVYAAQTPQCFERGLLEKAYAQVESMNAVDLAGITDDAGLVERLGHVVVVVEGDARNVKITRPADLEIARAIMGFRAPEGRATHKKF